MESFEKQNSDAQPLQLEVIIPNWNGSKLLRTCLDSLDSQEYQNFVITVVDNGSTDDSLNMLASEYPHVRVLSFSENKGFSVAVNLGIRKARTEWIVLLNNDMEVDSRCFSALINGIKRYPHVSFFAIKMYNFYNRNLLDGAGEAVLRGGAGYRLGTMEHDNEWYSQDRPCFGACGGAALYNRRVFTEIGYFDEEFFAYLEDVDLNLRASFKGMCCQFLTHAQVYHIGSATTGSKFNPTTIRLSTRNSITVLLKNYPTLLFVRFFPAIFLYQFMWMLFCIKKRLIFPWVKGMCEAFSPFWIKLFYTRHREFIRGHSIKDIWQQGNKILWAEKEAIRSIINRRKEQGKRSFLLYIYLYFFC